MTRPSPGSARNQRAANDFDSWLLGDPDLDENDLLLLAAYQQAAKDTTAPAAVAEDSSDAPSDDTTETKPAVRVQPTILRLAEVDGVATDRLSEIHGKLIAAGYLTADVLGRTDGIVYRITRDGQRRLAGESVDTEAA